MQLKPEEIEALKARRGRRARRGERTGVTWPVETPAQHAARSARGRDAEAEGSVGAPRAPELLVEGDVARPVRAVLASIARREAAKRN